MAPRVALIASTFRSERFLAAWLSSVEMQSIWADCELVVSVNDPRADETAMLSDFAARHSQVRLLVVGREPLYKSWNRAIAASSAPLIGIANVDDLRTPTSLEAQVEALEAHPEARFCYGTYSVVNEFPSSGTSARVVRGLAFDRELFTRGMHVGPFFVWRRGDELGTSYFDEQLSVGGDFDLAVRLALNGSGLCLDENLGFYYDAGTGLSTSGDTQPIEHVVLVLRYGIYDKLDIRYVPQAAEYVIPQLLLPDGHWLPMSSIIPDYEGFLDARRERWFKQPKPRRSALQSLRGWLVAVAVACRRHVRSWRSTERPS